MTTFQAGANGSNLVTAFLILSPISTDVPHQSEIDVTYSNGMSSVLSGSYTLSGGSLTGGTVTGWTIYNSDGSLDCSITGFNVSVQAAASSNVGSLILTQGITYRGSSNPSASDYLFGLGNDTFIGGAATELFRPAAGINTIRGGTGQTTVEFGGTLSTYTIVNEGNDAITVTDSVASRNGVDNISGVQTLQFTDVSVSVNADGTLAMPTATAAQALAWSKIGDLSPLTVSDYSGNVVADLSGLQTLNAAGELKTISLKDGGNIQLSLTPTQVTADAGALQAIATKGVYADISASTANLTLAGIGSMSNVAVFSAPLADYSVTPNGTGSITVTDTGTGRVSIDHLSGFTTLKFSDYTALVNANGTLALPSVSTAQAAAWSAVSDLAPLYVLDSSANVVANLSGLEALAKAGELASITLSNANTNPQLSITPAQLAGDLAAIQSISASGGAITLKVDASAANLTLTGAGTIATVAAFTGNAAEYSVAANSDGSVTVTDTGTGRTSVDHLSGFTALQFADETVFVTAPPGTANQPTTGNITELYSAALARTPDVAGLTFYQNFLKANPSTPLTSFAQFFLSSSEYTANPAHNYAQTSAGETKFVTDLYTNLLHRAPDSTAVPFYLSVINGLLAHDTAGTTLYSADDKAAHALVMTYISQSQEFLSDVQITAQNPASAQHWLVLG